MNIQPKRYARHPLFVQAIQVSAQNMAAVAEWCGGKIETDRNAKAYIKVDVIKPTMSRQGQAYVGEYVLKTDSGNTVYGAKAFGKVFFEAPEAADSVEIVINQQTPAEKLLTDIFVEPTAA